MQQQKVVSFRSGRDWPKWGCYLISHCISPHCTTSIGWGILCAITMRWHSHNACFTFTQVAVRFLLLLFFFWFISIRFIWLLFSPYTSKRQFFINSVFFRFTVRVEVHTTKRSLTSFALCRFHSFVCACKFGAQFIFLSLVVVAVKLHFRIEYDITHASCLMEHRFLLFCECPFQFNTQRTHMFDVHWIHLYKQTHNRQAMLNAQGGDLSSLWQ